MAPPRRVRGVEPASFTVRKAACSPSSRSLKPSTHVLALAPLAEVADAPGSRGELRVVRADRAAVPEGAEVLARVEREGRGTPEAAGATAVALGAVRLGGVLEQRKPVARRQAARSAGMSQSWPCRCTTRIAAVRGPTAAAAASTSSRPVSSSTSQSTGTAPAWSTASAEAMYVCAGHDHLVARADAGRLQRLIESAAVPGGDADALGRRAGRRPGLLEATDLLAEDERAPADDPLEGVEQLVRELGVLAIQRRERHLHQAAVPMLRPGGRRVVMRARSPLRSVRHHPNRNQGRPPRSSATDCKGTNRDCLRNCRDRKVGGRGPRAHKLRPSEQFDTAMGSAEASLPSGAAAIAHAGPSWASPPSRSPRCC